MSYIKYFLFFIRSYVCNELFLSYGFSNFFIVILLNFFKVIDIYFVIIWFWIVTISILFNFILFFVITVCFYSISTCICIISLYICVKPPYIYNLSNYIYFFPIEDCTKVIGLCYNNDPFRL